MHLHERAADSEEGVEQRDRRVRERSRIDEEAVHPRCSVRDEVEDRSLVIRLERLQLDAEGLGEFAELSVHVVERVRSVYLGLALAQQAKVGAVNDRDFHASSRGSHLSSPSKYSRIVGPAA